MSETLNIRRDGDEWFIENGSARIRLTNPSAGIVRRYVEKWEAEIEEPENPDEAGRRTDQKR